MKEDAISSDISGVHLWLIVWKAYRALEAVAHRNIATTGLCLSDFGILEILLNKGPLPVNIIGQKIQLTSGSITSAIDRLEKQGWVVRQPDPMDRRARIVHLTPPGRAVIEPLFLQHTQAMETTAAPLTPGERETLIRLLKKLGQHASKE